jgi:hypothetical protein
MFFEKLLDFSRCSSFHWAETPRTVTAPSGTDNPCHHHALARLVQDKFNSYGFVGYHRYVTYLQRDITVF